MYISDDKLKLIFESVPCKICHGNGIGSVKSKCSTCKGTGNGPRGGKRQCRNCLGYGFNWVPGGTCDSCVQKGLDPKTSGIENRYDWITQDIWKQLTFKVIRLTRSSNFNENYFGLGLAHGCIDYGRINKITDDNEVIETVKKETCSTQALNICREDGALADYMGIFIKPDGYHVRAVYLSDSQSYNRQLTQVSQLMNLGSKLHV